MIQSVSPTGQRSMSIAKRNIENKKSSQNFNIQQKIETTNEKKTTNKSINIEY